jgi:hypothetical protein
MTSARATSSRTSPARIFVYAVSSSSRIASDRSGTPVGLDAAQELDHEPLELLGTGELRLGDRGLLLRSPPSFFCGETLALGFLTRRLRAHRGRVGP